MREKIPFSLLGLEHMAAISGVRGVSFSPFPPHRQKMDKAPAEERIILHLQQIMQLATGTKLEPNETDSQLSITRYSVKNLIPSLVLVRRFSQDLFLFVVTFFIYSVPVSGCRNFPCCVLFYWNLPLNVVI